MVLYTQYMHTDIYIYKRVSGRESETVVGDVLWEGGCVHI